MLPTSASGPYEFLNTDHKGENHDVHGSWRYYGTKEHYRVFNESDSLFHSEFGVDGMMSVETMKTFLSEDNLKPDDMAHNHVWRHHGEWWDTSWRDNHIFGVPTTLEEQVACSQFMQAEGLRYAIEANRSGSLGTAISEAVERALHVPENRGRYQLGSVLNQVLLHQPIIGLETNMRPSGGFTPDMYNFAYETDVYKIWADMIAFDYSTKPLGTQRFCAFIGRRDHYRRTGVVSLRTWKKHFGTSYMMYSGTHFTEEEHIFDKVLPLIYKVLDIKQ